MKGKTIYRAKGSGMSIRVVQLRDQTLRFISRSRETGCPATSTCRSSRRWAERTRW